MKKSAFIIAIFFAMLQVVSCKEDKLGPVEHDKVAPGPVSGVEAVGLAGAARITYEAPGDKDLLYILAQYTNKQNKVIEVKASYYTNSLVVEGFGDTSVYEVKLYAVDRSENRSTPLVINVTPLQPPVYKAFDKLKVVPDFGGLSIKTINVDEADLAIVLLHKDSLGFYVTDNTNYTKRDTINFSVRGYAAELASFGIYVRDRWGNLSDTLFTDLTPLFEFEIDKTNFKQVDLPTDVAFNWGLPMPGMWDKKVAQEGNMWHSADVLKMPMHITFDLGVTVKLSRFTLWQRQGIYLYGHGNPLEYEVYGSTNPAPDGSFNGWTLLKSCKSVKPSGKPFGDNTNEDKAAALAGEPSDVAFDAPKVRYIRVKILKTWSGGVAAHISEMSFWGSDK